MLWTDRVHMHPTPTTPHRFFSDSGTGSRPRDRRISKSQRITRFLGPPLPLCCRGGGDCFGSWWIRPGDLGHLLPIKTSCWRIPPESPRTRSGGEIAARCKKMQKSARSEAEFPPEAGNSIEKHAVPGEIPDGCGKIRDKHYRGSCPTRHGACLPC